MNLSKKITCLIDDDEIYLFSVKKVIELNKLSEQVLEFRNGQEAIDFLTDAANHPFLPDVIFLDINMPVMDGWEFIDAFRQVRAGLPKDITLYVVSSSADRADVEKARSLAPVQDYFIKPITAAQFRQIYAGVGQS